MSNGGVAGGGGGIAPSILTAKGSLIVATAAQTPADFPVGADGLLLTADSTAPSGVRWVAGGGGPPSGAAGGDLAGLYPNPTLAVDRITKALLTTKGDLVVATAAATPARLGVGADGQVLRANSAAASGVDWLTLGGAALLNRVAAGNVGVLDATDATLTNSRPPNGAAGGDLAGNYPNPTVGAAAVTLGKMANLNANSIIGNNTGAPATPIALTAAQTKALLAIVAADLADFQTTVRANRLDQLAAPNVDLSIGTHKLINVADPTAAQDAATKNYVDTRPSGALVKANVDADTTFANTAALQTYATLAIPTTVAAGDRLHFMAFGETTHTAGGSPTITWSLLVGATTVLSGASSILSNAAGTPWTVELLIDVVAAATAQRVFGSAIMASAAGAFVAGAPASTQYGYATAAEDLTVAKNVVLKAQMSAASANFSVTLHAAHLELIPKG